MNILQLKEQRKRELYFVLAIIGQYFVAAYASEIHVKKANKN